jgi:hypothetical protein
MKTGFRIVDSTTVSSLNRPLSVPWADRSSGFALRIDATANATVYYIAR